MGSLSRVLRPPAGHSSAYSKFVMNKWMKAGNTQKILSANFLVS